MAGEVAQTLCLVHLGPGESAWEAAVAGLMHRNAVARMWEGDFTRWQDAPTEGADRLGWLHVMAEMLEKYPEYEEFADEISADTDHVVLMGMGGSSLYPEVLAATYGDVHDRPRLHVLDTTDPLAIARLDSECLHDRTFYVASSKSGGTLETRSHNDYFFDLVADPARFGVITDPGSPLESLAVKRGYRRVFDNRDDIGGRYSAMSAVGTVPSALVGHRGREVLEGGGRGVGTGSVGEADEAVGGRGGTHIIPDTPVTEGELSDNEGRRGEAESG